MDGGLDGVNAVNNAGLHCGVGLGPGNDNGAEAHHGEGVLIDLSLGAAELYALAVCGAGAGNVGADGAEALVAPAKSGHVHGIGELSVKGVNDVAVVEELVGNIKRGNEPGQVDHIVCGDIGGEHGGVGIAHIQSAGHNRLQVLRLSAHGAGGIGGDVDSTVGGFLDTGSKVLEGLAHLVVGCEGVGKLQFIGFAGRSLGGGILSSGGALFLSGGGRISAGAEGEYH